MLEHKIPPPLIGLSIGMAMWGCADYGPRWHFAGQEMLALALCVAGIVLAVSGVIAFHRHHTTVNPLNPEQTSALVCSGIYRHTRNPMYLGFALVLTSWAIYLAAPLTLIGPLLFVAWITRFQIIPEERILQQKFGLAFEQYRHSVRRWI